jgi:prepilin-type N-terminal cleavage/methylation domain-containing protein
MMQPRKAFTLMELLVVIGIIGILAGMVFAGVQVAKKESLKSKTRSILGQVTTALLSYKTLNSSYPDSYAPAWATSGYDGVFMSGTSVRKATDVTVAEWETSNKLLVDQLNASGQSFTSPINDAWNSALRYRPAKYFLFDDSAPILIDKDTGVPGRDSFQLWSIGRDQINQYGEKTFGGKTGDDLTSWSQ